LTSVFKRRYQEGESLDDLLPEAFAAMILADERVLGKHPYDVQILAGIAMHQGFLCEMSTGEGKTLSATMPLYLNALAGKSCFLVTTNDYLAIRDGKEMGEVYNFMGLTCSYPPEVPDNDEGEARKKRYEANIIYTTNSTVGFDYLFNNLVKKADKRFLCPFDYAIVDEADAVLLDSATMPLVISGVPRVQSNLYHLCDFFVTSLVDNIDYVEEEQSVWLTPKGVKYAERFFGIPNFYGKEYFEINRHVTLALRAHVLFERNKDYVVNDDNEVVLVDSSTGRRLTGVKMRGGQHQAIEAKEEVEITQESRTVASITYQNLFRMFDKLAGMSGTILDAKGELLDTYNKRVVKIPTNKPVIRDDRKDLFYPNAKSQFYSAAAMVLELHKKEQPVLVVLSSVSDTDLFSRLMLKENVPHNVLNANNAFWEAQIIAGAGQKGAVTIATSMAGRGTDIKLGEGVQELGGLAVIGVGRMENVRSERQARGRSGRQGDPGFSQFFVSLEDDIVDADDNEKLQKYIEETKKISKHKLKKIINNKQKVKTDYGEISRKQSVQYDAVLKRQRQYIYEARNSLLDGDRIEESRLMEFARENISDFVETHDVTDMSVLTRYILDNISYSLDERLQRINLEDDVAVENYLLGRVRAGLAIQHRKINDNERYEQFVREATLNAIDEAWVELIDYLEQLKSAVSGRASAQRNVVFEYQNEAFDSYNETEKIVKRNIIRNIMLSTVSVTKNDKLSIIYP